MKQVLTMAKWAAALSGLFLSPLALGMLVFALYFIVDGARTLGHLATSAIFCALLGTTLLFRWRRSHPPR